MPNFVEISQTVAEIWQFIDFCNRAAVRHLRVLDAYWYHPPTVLVGAYDHSAKFG